MTDQDKPRICQVLGVEVGEQFFIGGYPTDYGLVQVCEDGKVRRVLSKELQEVFGAQVGHKIGSNALYYLLNHPDRIIRKPRFTPDEAAVLRHMSAAGVTSIMRESDTHIYWDGGDMGGVMVVPPDFLPSIHPGQDIVLNDGLAAVL